MDTSSLPFNLSELFIGDYISPESLSVPLNKLSPQEQLEVCQKELEAKIASHNKEIEELCSTQYKSFIDCIQDLLLAQPTVDGLKQETVGIDAQLLKPTDTLQKKAEDLIKSRKILLNSILKIEELITKCIFVLQQYSKLIQKLLERYKQALKVLVSFDKESLRDYLDDINQNLDSLKDISRNKILSKRLIECIRHRNKIEATIERRDHTDQLMTYDILEIANVSLYHLNKQLLQIQPTNKDLIAIKTSLEDSINKRQIELDNWFESSFVKAIESSDVLLMGLVLRTYGQKDAFDKIDDIFQSKIVTPSPNLMHTTTDSPFSLKICNNISGFISMCWSEQVYVAELEFEFIKLSCSILNRFGDWLGKLSLSDFRIISAVGSSKLQPTNFLAKQNALMRLLITDCETLIKKTDELVESNFNKLENQDFARQMFDNSFQEVEKGLTNVRSLQKLIEK